MRLYNTLSRRVEEFRPLEGSRVRMYTCGPTVYDFAHIGNFRTYIFEDILRRYLRFAGFEVVQVMNITDVDDKTIKGAIRAGVSLDAYTAQFIKAFFEDLDALRIERAERYPRATEHVPEMIALIERLLKSGHAYRSEDGSVYFNLAAFHAYGKLVDLDRAGLRPGARVAQDEYEKEQVADFALWKAWDDKDGAVAWDSPWGRGRPGWHIECSAMSMKYLGESFDIHTGGVDNKFPHHENEIAQSEAATGKPFVKHWLHSEHLVVEGHKMSKSLGNFYTLRDVLRKGFSGREIRYMLLSAQYRQRLNFTFEALAAARASLARMDEFTARLRDVVASDAGLAADRVDPPPVWAAEARAAFLAAMDDDLNVPEALSAVFGMIRAGNRAFDGGELDASGAASVVGVLADLDRVLAVLDAGGADTPDQAVSSLVEKRRQAREARQWAESDRLRAEIAGLGWEVRDTPDGQKLKRLSPA